MSHHLLQIFNSIWNIFHHRLQNHMCEKAELDSHKKRGLLSDEHLFSHNNFLHAKPMFPCGHFYLGIKYLSGMFGVGVCVSRGFCSLHYRPLVIEVFTADCLHQIVCVSTISTVYRIFKILNLWENWINMYCSKKSLCGWLKWQIFMSKRSII